MALQTFPHYISAVCQNVLPLYPLIAADDLNDIMYRRVDEASEQSPIATSQDFDIVFAGAVLRLGHRLFEQSPDATQLRKEGDSNIDQFEHCNWRQFAHSTQPPTKVLWLVEGMSFTFIYHLCGGLPTMQARMNLITTCERLTRCILLPFHLFLAGKKIRNREAQEWNQPETFGELVKLIVIWLMLL